MSKSKTMGQVFTPAHIVEFMLDNIGYTVQGEILNKSIYEPSFGQGIFLLHIVDRLIGRAAAENVPLAVVSELLNINVHGVEYDEVLYKETIANLTAHVQSKGITPPRWDNLVQADALGHHPVKPFDYIVGNPPYIRTHNLTDEMRENMDRFAITATGTPDMYVTFMEYGLSVLKPGGKLSYIVPNTWLKNTSQKPFREHVFGERLVESIHDYMSEKVFSNAGTYTAVVVCSQGNRNLAYSQKEAGTWVTSVIPYKDLIEGETWLFQSPKNQELLKTNRALGRTFGDICVIQNALMTMRNGIYLAADAAGVEEGILYDAVKASTFRGGSARDRILFPYKNENGTISPYSEDELKALFPNAYSYLLENKEELLARKRDVSADWFHYGRSQGVALLPAKRKIVFRQHLSDSQKTMDVHILPESTLVYGGWFIMEKEDSDYTLEDIKEIMESEEFCTVMRLMGKDMSGGYKELYSKHLKSFGIK
jgi:adenine-specific DNA-methyltransferase